MATKAKKTKVKAVKAGQVWKGRAGRDAGRLVRVLRVSRGSADADGQSYVDLETVGTGRTSTTTPDGLRRRFTLTPATTAA